MIEPTDGFTDGDFEFESTLEEIDAIVEKLDRDGVGLDEAIGLFERGIKRLNAANQWLESVSGRIEELIASSTGTLRTTPLTEDDEASEDEVDESTSSN